MRRDVVLDERGRRDVKERQMKEENKWEGSSDSLLRTTPARGCTKYTHRHKDADIHTCWLACVCPHVCGHAPSARVTDSLWPNKNHEEDEGQSYPHISSSTCPQHACESNAGHMVTTLNHLLIRFLLFFIWSPVCAASYTVVVSCGTLFFCPCSVLICCQIWQSESPWYTWPHQVGCYWKL